MSITLAISLVALFIGVALVSQLVLSEVLSWTAPERKRLRDLEVASTGVLRDEMQLVETPIPALRQLAKAMPKLSARRTKSGLARSVPIRRLPCSDFCMLRTLP